MGRALPRSFFVHLGAFVGRFVFDVLRIRREVTLSNLARVFGASMSDSELLALGRRSYASLGRALLEFCSLWSMDEASLLETVRFVNEEALQRPLEEGNGFILVPGHYGSWELLGSDMAAKGYPMTFLVKDMKNPLVARLQDELRVRGKLGVVKDGPVVARGVLRVLRNNGVVGILPDQDARRHGVFVDFLGQPSSTYKGPAFFARRANVPIIACYIRREADGIFLGSPALEERA
jgi:KDO2-lipid IV(A) lauroyltransferase